MNCCYFVWMSQMNVSMNKWMNEWMEEVNIAFVLLSFQTSHHKHNWICCCHHNWHAGHTQNVLYIWVVYRTELGSSFLNSAHLNSWSDVILYYHEMMMLPLLLMLMLMLMLMLFCSVLALNPPEYLPTDNKFGCKNGFTKRL